MTLESASFFLVTLGGLLSLLSSSIVNESQQHLAALLVLAGVACEATQAAQEKRRPAILQCPVSWVGCGLLLAFSLLSEDPLEFVKKDCGMLVALAGGATLLISAKTLTHRRSILWALLATMTLMAAHGLWQRLHLLEALQLARGQSGFLNGLAPSVKPFLQGHLARSSLSSPNVFGGYLACFAPLMFLLKNRATALAISLMWAAGLWASGSRGALFVALLGAALMARNMSSPLRQLGNVILFVMLAAMAAASLMALNWLPTPGVFETLSYRADYWEHAIALIRRNPVFGVGPDGYGPATVAMEGQWSLHPHNAFLSLAAEYGLPTAALMLGLILVSMKKWRPPVGASLESPHGKMTQGFLLLACGLAAMNPAIYFFWDLSPGVFQLTALVVNLIFLLGAVIVLQKTMKGSAQHFVDKALAIVPWLLFVHAMVDFDIHFAGFLMAAMLIVGARGATIKLKNASSLAGMGVALSALALGAIRVTWLLGS